VDDRTPGYREMLKAFSISRYPGVRSSTQVITTSTGAFPLPAVTCDCNN